VPRQQHIPELAGLEVTRWQTGQLAMSWGFNLNLITHDSFGAHAAFDGNLYDPAGAQALIQAYQELLLQIVTYPDTLIRVETREPVLV